MFLLYVSSFCSFYFAIFVLIRTVFDFTNRELIFPVADLLFIIQFTSDSGIINLGGSVQGITNAKGGSGALATFVRFA